VGGIVGQRGSAGCVIQGDFNFHLFGSNQQRVFSTIFWISLYTTLSAAMVWFSRNDKVLLFL
jgi:hypothetical protein